MFFTATARNNCISLGDVCIKRMLKVSGFTVFYDKMLRCRTLCVIFRAQNSI